MYTFKKMGQVIYSYRRHNFQIVKVSIKCVSQLFKIDALLFMKIRSDRGPELALKAEPLPCTYTLRSTRVHELWIFISLVHTEYVLYEIPEHDRRIVIYIYTHNVPISLFYNLITRLQLLCTVFPYRGIRMTKTRSSASETMATRC